MSSAVPRNLGVGLSLLVAGALIVIVTGTHQLALRAAFPGDTQSQATNATYTANVLPILQNKCLGCHNIATKMGGLVMDSFESLQKGGAHGPIVVPGKSGDSKLVMMLEGKIQPRMPLNADPLSPAEMTVIKSWIDAGAKGPQPRGLGAHPHELAIPDIKPQVPVVSPVTSISFSPDGRVMAVGGYKDVRLVDPVSGRIVATLTGHAGVVEAICFSPDGRLLAAAGGLAQRMGEIKIWDVRSLRLVRTLTGHTDGIYAAAFSPDGKLIASGSYDYQVKLWEVETGRELLTLKDHTDAVFSVAFSPDGKRLASGAQDRTVKVWDPATGQRLYTLGGSLGTVTTIAFNPSGNQLASAGEDRIIRVWNLEDKGGTLAQSIYAHEDTILCLAYSPDGKRLISTSADRTIKIWDPSTSTAIKVLDHQSDWVQALSVSANRRFLAVGRFDGTITIYDLDSYRQILGPIVAFDVFQPTTAATVRPRISAR